MFAGYDAGPVVYHRYVTYDGRGDRGPDWHPHSLSPVLNRKRLSDGLRDCAADGRSATCAAFVAFAQSGARAMVPRPAKIAIQYRTWDFARDLDAPHYCDAMTVVALDVEGGAVSEAAGLPCDFIDWDAPAGRNMGTV